ncbi:MAG: hypothetical protein IIW20_00615, partial [Clostridia bacterium]|nr:hypothetical protein [Clostridia bacterium]
KKKVKEGKMRLIALSGGKGEFLGLMVLYFYKELVLLDYFAVENDARGKGIGSSALEKLKAEYEKARIVIEIEDTETDCAELAVRLRRKDFYLRHGAEVMEYKVMLFGVKMHILSIGGEVTFEEYYAILQDMWQRGVSRYVYETE